MATRKKTSTSGKKTRVTKKTGIGRKFGTKANKKVGRSMHEMKAGTLRSGRSGKKVTSKKQAIAIGLSEARREGEKVPSPRSPRKRSRNSGGKAAASSKRHS